MLQPALGRANSSFVNLISDWPFDTPGAICPQLPHFSRACRFTAISIKLRSRTIGYTELMHTPISIMSRTDSVWLKHILIIGWGDVIH